MSEIQDIESQHLKQCTAKVQSFHRDTGRTHTLTTYEEETA